MNGVWYLLGGIAFMLWVNLLDGPKLNLPPKYSVLERPLEFLVKLTVIGGVYGTGFVVWKLVS